MTAAASGPEAILADVAWGALRIAERSALQFALLVGGFAAAAFALTWLARCAGNLHRQFIWPKAPLVIFGSVGVPVHELGHALFCVLFGHDVRRIKWFDMSGRGGSQGSVEHSYRPANFRHRLGQLFIGVGPTLLGPALIAVLFACLAPTARGADLASLARSGPWWAGLAKGADALAAAENWRAPAFWIFVYLSAAIASQAELSKEDLAQARAGAVIAALALLATNALAAIAGSISGAAWASTLHDRVLVVGEAIARGWIGVAGLSVAFSAATLALTWAVMSLIHVLARRELPNPFRDA